MTPLLEVRGLRTVFPSEDGTVVAVDDVSFDVRAGERFGIVGESGSGKSVTAMSVMGLVDKPGRVEAGEVRFRGRSLGGLRRQQLEDIRGAEIAMVFQNPLTSLNPVLTIGAHLTGTIRRHLGCNRADSRRRAIDLLGQVGIPAPARRVDEFPHQLSGGMRQRVMIACALSCDPSLVIADEPTTALDVTVQAQILELLTRLAADRDMAVMLITHDLGVVASFCERVMVMYAGRAVEVADVRTLFHRPAHPYTWGLLESVASMELGTDGLLPAISGSPPDLARPPSGCSFHPRCPHVQNLCRDVEPALSEGAGHPAACHFAGTLERLG